MKAGFLVYILASLMAPSIDSVPLAQKKLYLISPGVINAISRASTPRSGSINSWLGIGVRYVNWSLTAATIIRVAPAQVHHPVPTQAVQVLAPEDIPENRAGTGPFGSRPIPGLRDGFAILQPAFIEMVGKVLL